MNHELSVGIALLAGLVSFASPCIVPLVPSYLSFVAGGIPKEKSINSQLRALWRTCFFVLGFGIVFALLGTIFAGGGLALGSSVETIRIVAGLVVIFFGINTVFDFVPFLNYQARAQVRSKPVNAAGALLVGMAFGAGWTPCIGPILASILFLAGSSVDIGRGVVYLAAYTIGLGVPFLIMSLAIDRLRSVLRWMNTHAPRIKIASGLLLIGLGILIAFGQLAALVRFSVVAGTALGQWAAHNELAARLAAACLYAVAGFAPLIFWLARRRSLLQNEAKGLTARNRSTDPTSTITETTNPPSGTPNPPPMPARIPFVRIGAAILCAGLMVAELLAGPLLAPGIGAWLSFQGL